jgi:SOS-response transcriptional repressor LexA
VTDDAVEQPLGFGVASPRAIRDALLEEERAAFDRQFREAMAVAAESLDLSGVLDMLRGWRRIVELTERDGAEQRRRILRRAVRIWRNRDSADSELTGDAARLVRERMSEAQRQQADANRARILGQFEAGEPLTDSEGRPFGRSEPYVLVPLAELRFGNGAVRT